MRFFVSLFICAGALLARWRLYALLAVASALALAACTTHQTGPERPIAIADDVTWIRALAEPDLTAFYRMDMGTQAAVRNQVVTARMYIADMEYHYYEARLTREIQDEGLLATAASLGLTTSATLIPVTQTKTLLSGIATGVTGLDKAYNEKILLSNTIQALQAQMRADRKTEAGVIFAKMFKGENTKTITPISEYTLPMALADADAYYQAGTISSALVGLSKTVATAERNADQAKAKAGPNPDAVSNVKEAALPSPAPTLRITTVARDVTYTNLRAQLFPGGKADPELVAYVKKLVGPNVAIGPILADARFATLRQRISACIVSHKAGQDCPDGSLSDLIQ